MPRLTIPPDVLAGFVWLRGLGAESLKGLEKPLSEVLLRATELENILAAAKVGDPKLVGRVLVSLTMLSFSGSSTLFADITAALRDDARWTHDEIDAWTKLEPVLESLLQTVGLVTLSKVIRLQYEHTNILTEMHVITDVRPVFDHAATRPLAAVTCHTLRVVYQDREGTHHLSLALDNPDLEKLIAQAKRALQKAEVLGSFLEKPVPLRNRTAGGDDDG